jgi:hypothetical protein
MGKNRKIEKLLAPGCTLGEQGKSGHRYVLGPDGEKLRLPSGLPLMVSVSPSDYRTRKNELARQKKALRGENPQR